MSLVSWGTEFHRELCFSSSDLDFEIIKLRGTFFLTWGFIVLCPLKFISSFKWIKSPECFQFATAQVPPVLPAAMCPAPHLTLSLCWAQQNHGWCHRWGTHWFIVLLLIWQFYFPLLSENKWESLDHHLHWDVCASLTPSNGWGYNLELHKSAWQVLIFSSSTLDVLVLNFPLSMCCWIPWMSWLLPKPLSHISSPTWCFSLPAFFSIHMCSPLKILHCSFPQPAFWSLCTGRHPSPSPSALSYPLFFSFSRLTRLSWDLLHRRVCLTVICFLEGEVAPAAEQGFIKPWAPKELNKCTFKGPWKKSFITGLLKSNIHPPLHSDIFSPFLLPEQQKIRTWWERLKWMAVDL